jgi:hypothetical protein
VISRSSARCPPRCDRGLFVALSPFHPLPVTRSLASGLVDQSSACSLRLFDPTLESVDTPPERCSGRRDGLIQFRCAETPGRFIVSCSAMPSWSPSPSRRLRPPGAERQLRPASRTPVHSFDRHVIAGVRLGWSVLSCPDCWQSANRLDCAWRGGPRYAIPGGLGTALVSGSGGTPLGLSRSLVQPRSRGRSGPRGFWRAVRAGLADYTTAPSGHGPRRPQSRTLGVSSIPLTEPSDNSPLVFRPLQAKYAVWRCARPPSRVSRWRCVYAEQSM